MAAKTKTPAAAQGGASTPRYIPIVDPMACILNADGAQFGVAPDATPLELARDVHYLLCGAVEILAMVTQDETGGALDQLLRLARHAAAVTVDRLTVPNLGAGGGA